jgi:hypothetical protein
MDSQTNVVPEMQQRAEMKRCSLETSSHATTAAGQTRNPSLRSHVSFRRLLTCRRVGSGLLCADFVASMPVIFVVAARMSTRQLAQILLSPNK